MMIIEEIEGTIHGPSNAAPASRRRKGL